ncbi:MAG: polysaccharide biosynthesis/export family protein [Longimicrobiales bacterium]|nr:polysaccharide biosynthesis/export family protein [Longimicrobiales bacterium]
MTPLRALGLTLLLLLALPHATTAQVSDTTGVTFGTQTLKPGDIVRLAIWREPTFSGDFTVDEAGYVTLPRIGQIQVTDFTPPELQANLLARYRTFLRNPSIEISILKRIRILGSVQQPGLYPVDATVSLADALALAGGVTPDGKQDKIELRRAGETVVTELTPESQISAMSLISGDQLFVPERSWISRNSGVFAATISAVVTIVIALTR